MKRLNAIELLILHFTNHKTVERNLYESFWFDRFSTNPEPIKNKLINDGIIYISSDLRQSLSNLKVDELKKILRENKLKVSGKKVELINRIIENNANLEDFNLPQVYNVVPEYEKLLNDTSFLKDIIHIYPIDIFDAYDYYLEYPNLTSESYFEQIIAGNIKQLLSQKEYSKASYLYSIISRHYFNKRDEKSGLFNLNSHIMLSLLDDVERIVELKKYGYDHFDYHTFYIGEDDIRKYRSLLKTNQITEEQLFNDLIESVSMVDLNMKYKEIMASFVLNKIENIGNENDSALKDILNVEKNNNNKVNKNDRPVQTLMEEEKNHNKHEIIIKSDNTPIKKEQKGLFSKLKNKFLK